MMTHGISVQILFAAALLELPGAAIADDVKKPDAGKFTMTIQGTKAGTAAFKFDSEGGCDADVAIDVAGQNQKIKLGVKAKGGKITNVSASAGPANKFTAAIDGAKANLSINNDAATPQTIPAGAVPFGNFSPFLLNFLLNAYDSKKAGAQTFDLLLIEGLPNGQFVSFKGKLTGKGAAGRKVAGKLIQITSYSLMIMAGGTEIEMKLYADPDRHLLAWDVPSQVYTAVRDGYEDILKPSAPAK